MDNSMLLSCSSSTSTVSPKPYEASKASPVSLCENQNPSPPPMEKRLHPNVNSTKLTLGQTLKNELRKSSIRIHNYQKEAEEDSNEGSLVIDCDEDEEQGEDEGSHNGEELFQSVAAACLVDTTAALPVNGVLGRRRRPRRNPVWLYFQVEEGLASCKHCDYKTKSIFSTNLKVHLKSHHRRLFDQVLEAEEVMAAATENAAQAMKALKQNNEDIFPAVRRAYHTVAAERGSSEVYELQQQKLLNSSSPPPFLSTALYQHQQQQGSARNCVDDDQTAVCNSGGNQANSYLSAALANSNAPFSSMKALTDILSNPLPSSATTNSHLLLQEVCNGQPMSIQSALASLSSDTNNEHQNLAEKFKQKRKRLRRHPVWTFFKDFEDKIVGCIMCNFRTTSAFSTNLKMHLRAHHKEEYLQVMESELEQCVDGRVGKGEEGLQPMEAPNTATNYSHHNFENGLQTVQVNSRTGRVKRKRKTAEELQMIIEKCKSNMEREKEKRSSMLMASARSAKSSRKSSVPDFNNCSSVPTNMLEQTACSNPVSASDQLNAMIAGMLSNGSNSQNNCPSTQFATLPPPVDDAAYISHDHHIVNENSANSPVSQTNEQDDLKEFLNHLNEVIENESNKDLLAVLRKQARDFAFSKLAQTLGSSTTELLNNSAFQLFVYALAPDYDLIKLEEIHQQQQLLAKINQ
uniref:BED-type domain-containing protein n=1 Tax=Ditylenchus dipsaci TaxID=166011 RepID=A0A915D5N3_9BILA